MLLIFDANNIAHKAKHAFKGLSFEGGNTNVIFGFLSQVINIAFAHKGATLVFCWDALQYKRKKLYPEYKANRKKEKTDEEMAFDASAYKQMQLLKTDILPYLGCKNNFHQPGYEADDLIAHLVHKYRKDEIITIVSSDSDLYQLLDSYVSIYKNNKRIYDYEFLKQYGISHRDWPRVRAWAGCTADNIKGLAGVGEKTAIKFINGKLNTQSKIYQKFLLKESIEMFDRNMKLVKLPFPGVQDISITENNFTFEAFDYACARYGLTSFFNKESVVKWKDIFK